MAIASANRKHGLFLLPSDQPLFLLGIEAGAQRHRGD
jgi:hypothetical protein